MTGSQQRRRSPHLIVYGGDSLAYHLVQKLVEAINGEVTVILPSEGENYGTRIGKLQHVRVIKAPELSEDAFRRAGVERASAVALISQNEVGNIHAALLAQELKNDLRLVIRFSDMNLRAEIQKLLPECAVLSDADTAAPFFAVGAVDEQRPIVVRLQDRKFYVRRRKAAKDNVIWGLAKDSESEQPTLLPTDQNEADLVLVEGHTAVGDTSARRRGRDLLRSLWKQIVAFFSADTVARRRRRNWPRVLWWRITSFFNAKLIITILVLFALLVLGTVLFATVGGFSFPDALYFTFLDAAGAAQPDTKLSTINKFIQAMVTFVGISIVPAVTATVVEAVVNSRLAAAGLSKPRGIADHVVVVGLGNVGTSVVTWLRGMGVDVVCVDSDANARGVPLVTQTRPRTPIVIGDASLEKTLKDARLRTCRALVAVTNDDATNLVVALQGHAMRQKLESKMSERLRIALRAFQHDAAKYVKEKFKITIFKSLPDDKMPQKFRVVLRSLNDDLAERVKGKFDITISESVSKLAAPAFVAAMLRLDVLQTIPVGQHRVLLIAEVPIHEGFSLADEFISNVNKPGEVLVIAITLRGTGTLTQPARPHHRLASGDKLFIVATRAGLGQVLTRATEHRPREPEPASPTPDL